jgi:hypothetical protein
VTEIERIDHYLAQTGMQLAKAEDNLDYEMVSLLTADIDRLLDRRSALMAASC